MVDHRLLRAATLIAALVAFSAFYQTVATLGAGEQLIGMLLVYALVVAFGARYTWTGDL